MPIAMETMTQEDLVAALQLCSWKHLVLDPQSARELEEEVKLCDKQRLHRYVPPPSDEFPLALREVVGKYCSPPWRKQLTDSDLLGTQTRLLLKQSYVKNNLYPLLTSREVEEMKGDGIVVNVYDGEGNIYQLIFKLWGLKAHVLTNHNWLNFARDHDLVKDDWITLWMFKHVGTRRLCFAIETKPLAAVPVASGGKRVVRLDRCNSQKRSRNIVSERDPLTTNPAAEEDGWY